MIGSICMGIIVGFDSLVKKTMPKRKTFTLKVNYRLAPSESPGNTVRAIRNGYDEFEIIEQLTQQANLTLGKNKWYANHFQALEKENGDMVFKMRVVFK